MKSIRLILFDLDDTLVHFDDYWEISVKETFAQYPLTCQYDADACFRIFDRVDRKLVELLDRQQMTIDDYRLQRYLMTMEQLGNASEIDAALAFERLYQSIGKRNMKPDAKVNQLIAELGEHYNLGIITNGSQGWQRDKLEAIGLREAFPQPYVYISGDIGHEKPSQAIYRHVLEQASLSPTEVLVIGDSWENDVNGPMKEGMQAIWFNPKKKPISVQAPRPLAMIEHLEELRALLLPMQAVVNIRQS
ncbi:HAD family hydrolase [Paenibacillus methanolicus]|uniref:Putative hydrolase of the HAD superfamily n=1 Tax=Paenibacillus methanolicus TaxID=582686 RepID=A0A5S5C420_9BACL|nr:HAD family hydrolase [Paenibacillus methanolicus]TYP74074.1 putative hydrolase of the HAD superfamily [Paenibacillus methanolicus]